MCFHTDMDNASDGGHQIFGVFEPPIGVVDDAALLVLNDAIAIHEPSQRGPSVDLVLMGFRRNSGDLDVLVDLEDALCLVFESHFACSDTEMLRFGGAGLVELDLQRVLGAVLVVEVQR